MEYKTCSFFGHRDILTNINSELFTHIEYVIETLGVNEFYVGGYGQFDALAKDCISELKAKYPDIKLFLALAYMPTKDTYIDKTYDGSVFFDGLETGPKRFAITKRNKIMARESDVIICYIRQNHGGAYTAVNYAKNQGELIFNCLKNDVF